MADLKFAFKIQDYQTEAASSVVDVFRGQPYQQMLSYVHDIGRMREQRQESLRKSSHEVSGQMVLLTEEDDGISDVGYMNQAVRLTGEELLRNIRDVQDRRNIRSSEALFQEKADKKNPATSCCSLDVEMETGTGKTYVYIETMYELMKAYGWSKYIVVVPSVAIREGVKKTFEVTADHFLQRYGQKARFFVYDSHDLTKLDDFATDAGLNVMIINMQAFNTSMKEDGRSKEARIIYSKQDDFGSRRPIDVIAAMNPIVIMDEPQKMSGPATKKGIQRFHPLFTLNYSATHKEKHDLVYVLDAVDAYQQRLVKQIEVKGFRLQNLSGTGGFVYLDDIVLDKKKPPCAKICLEVRRQSGVKREYHSFYEGDDLYPASHELEGYKNRYRIAHIDPHTKQVEFTGGAIVRLHESLGDMTEEGMRRAQIRETIKSHFEKEKQLFQRGIKTLSLFFIDEVAKYRQYDENGDEVLGDYGRIFEEEYQKILQGQGDLFAPEYMDYLNGIEVQDTHKGYFSIDKKGHAVDSETKRGEDSSDDVSAYDLIMRKKERLLSFEEPTRFIFSHSALREGWDNPNVFQICTLKQSDNKTTKRQEVGRGMRLCVDQSGNRMDAQALGDEVHKINKLTVIASESYEAFVEGLQRDIRNEFNRAYRQREATAEYFAGKNIELSGESVKLTEKQGQLIYQYLVKNDYVNEDNHITDTYKTAVVQGTLASLPTKLVDVLPSQFLENREMTETAVEVGVHRLIQSVFDDAMFSGMITDGNKVKIPSNELNENFYKEEFQKLWNQINYHYAYRVDFDSDELIEKAVQHLDEELHVSVLQYTLATGKQYDDLDADMVDKGESFTKARKVSEKLTSSISRVKYDLLGKLVDVTHLTRRTLAGILMRIQPSTFDMFRQNPEEFIRKAGKLINEQKATMVVEHITYHRLEDRYDEDIFTAGEQREDFSKAFQSYNHKSVQDYVFTDGFVEDSTERQFAKALEDNSEVKIYAKLPRGFQIPTPVGNYAPDWAVVFEDGTVKHIYFIAETKGSMSTMDISPIERSKIRCTKKLFQTLSDGKVLYDHVKSFEDLLNLVM